jgi:ABC-type polar amino acid transport system ATPase subunit
MVFQSFNLFPHRTVLDNVMLAPMVVKGESRKTAQDRAEGLLRKVHLAEFAHRYPAQLSGGQQQRAAIARALANDPPVIAADEPTGNLDSRTAAAVLELLAALAREGKTVVLVTHERELGRIADRVITLGDGRLIDDAPQVRRAAHG